MFIKMNFHEKTYTTKARWKSTVKETDLLLLLAFKRFDVPSVVHENNFNTSKRRTASRYRIHRRLGIG